MTRVSPAWSLGVLAGGASQRMGEDKATLPFRGRTLLEHAAALLAPAGVPVLISTRAPRPGLPAAWRQIADAQMTDAAAPGDTRPGPLAGMAALAAAATTPYVLIVPCDMPLLPAGLGDRLLTLLSAVDAVLISHDGRTEPFPALIAADLAGHLAALLRAGERRADAWHASVRAAVVPFAVAFPGVDAAMCLLNVNDRSALAAAERAAGRVSDPPPR